MKNKIRKLATFLSTGALAFAITTYVWGCTFVVHQPEVPAALKQMKNID